VKSGIVRMRGGEENTGHCIKWMIRNLQEEVVEIGIKFYILNLHQISITPRMFCFASLSSYLNFHSYAIFLDL